VTPLEKVTELLDGLKEEVETDGKKEAEAYNEFSCFCKSKTDGLSDSIVKGKDNINSLSAEIGEKTAQKTNTEEALVIAKKRKEEIEKAIADKEAECASGLAAYKASDADLTKAISSLEGAIDSLENAKPTPAGAAAAGFIAIKKTVKDSLMLADALKLVEDGPKWAQARAFIQIQESSGVDPSDPEYKYHSQGIIKVLQDLLKSFTDKKNEADLAEKERSEACVKSLEEYNLELELLKMGILHFEKMIGELAEGIASARNSLVEADAVLKDDQLYLKDLTAMCEERAKDYDQRAYTRNTEIATLTKALEVLGTTPEQAKRAAFLLQAKRNRTSDEQAPISFLQTVSEHRQHEEQKSQGDEQAGRRGRALKMLREAGGKLHSTALLAVASKAEAGPFEKVKVMIEKLIERLVQEATEEATKKGYCDTYLARAEKDRTFRYQEVMTLNADLEALEVKRDFLTAEIDDLAAAIESLTEDLAKATDIRKEDKDNNMATIKKDKEGQVVIKEAIMILETFYKEAAKVESGFGNEGKFAEGFIQTKKYSPTEDDTSGPGFEGQYAGKQDAMKGIVGLLQVMLSDFEREDKQTFEAEKEAQAAFVRYDRSAKADIAAKTTKKELDQEDLTTTKATIESKMEEMKKNMDLVDQAVAELEALKPMCIDSGMSYETRVEKREEEIEHLKTALCILDEAKVEAECQ
jgi:hypothetical protein